jgi:hypothetical protein
VLLFDEVERVHAVAFAMAARIAWRMASADREFVTY